MSVPSLAQISQIAVKNGPNSKIKFQFGLVQFSSRQNGRDPDLIWVEANNQGAVAEKFPVLLTIPEFRHKHGLRRQEMRRQSIVRNQKSTANQPPPSSIHSRGSPHTRTAGNPRLRGLITCFCLTRLLAHAHCTPFMATPLDATLAATHSASISPKLMSSPLLERTRVTPCLGFGVWGLGFRVDALSISRAHESQPLFRV